MIILHPYTSQPILYGTYFDAGTFVAVLAAVATPATGPSTTPTTGPSTHDALPDPDPIIKRHEDGGATGYNPLTDPLQAVPTKRLITALPGQYIDLKADYTPPTGVTATYQWTIDDTKFKNYDPSKASSQLTPMAAGDLTSQTVQFHWTDAKQHQVSVTITLSSGGNTTHSATFNIEKPSVDFAVAIGQVATGSQELPDMNFYDAIGLFSTGGTRIGNPNPGGTPGDGQGHGHGIVWPSQVEMPPAWPQGTWVWAQLVTPDAYVLDAGSLKEQDGNGKESLDSTFPFESPHPPFPTHALGADYTGRDTPCIADGGGTFTKMWFSNQRHRTWIMFMPDNEPNSNYVPLQMFTWQFGGTTVKAGTPPTWGAATGAHQSNTNPSPTTEHPTWSSVSGHTWVAASVALSVAVPTSANKTAGILTNQGTVTAPAAVTADVVVNLSTSNPTILTVPATVTIPNGQSSATFSLTVINTAAQTTDQQVQVFGQSQYYGTGVGQITIQH